MYVPPGVEPEDPQKGEQGKGKGKGKGKGAPGAPPPPANGKGPKPPIGSPCAAKFFSNDRDDTMVVKIQHFEWSDSVIPSVSCSSAVSPTIYERSTRSYRDGQRRCFRRDGGGHGGAEAKAKGGRVTAFNAGSRGWGFAFFLARCPRWRRKSCIQPRQIASVSSEHLEREPPSVTNLIPNTFFEVIMHFSFSIAHAVVFSVDELRAILLLSQ